MVLAPGSISSVQAHEIDMPLGLARGPDTPDGIE